MKGRLSMGDGKSKTRTGVSVNLLAAVAWLSAIGAEGVPILVAVAILALEKDRWLRKELIKMLATFAIIRTFNFILFTHIFNNVFFVRSSGETTGLHWLEVIILLLEDVLYIIFAIRAWKQIPDYSSLNHFAEKCLTDQENNNMADGAYAKRKDVTPTIQRAVCPNCGRPVSDEMDFCVNCGTKVR